MMIELKDIGYTINSNTILQNINLSIKKQDFIVFIGANGGGKSTLLKIILGLLPKHQGTIKYDKNLKFGYVPQNHQNSNINHSLPIDVISFVKLGVYKNLFDRLTNKLSPKELDKKALNALTKVGLEKFATSKISSLSGGQLQKAMIARAILDDIDVLVLDEPTSNIDNNGVKDVFNLLTTLNKNGVTILLVNHDIKTTFAYGNTIVHVDKVLTFHKNNIQNLIDSQQTHFCEVELIKMMQERHNQNCNHATYHKKEHK